MITKNAYMLATIFVILISTMTLPLAFAEDKLVSIPAGTAVPGCEETDECFIPASITVNPRDTVTWANDDTAAHTVTSGSVDEGGPDGNFDSSLFMAGTTFSQTFDTLGVYPYFCMVHPWMEGSVLVTVGGGTEIPLGTIVIGDQPADHTTVFGMTSDGNVRVEINTGIPITGEKFSLEVNFRDSTSGLKQHANYDITATQNGNTVLSEAGAHEHEGTGQHETAPLPSDDPVDIQVTINGFGLPGEESNWTGPNGEVISLQVVPEFGTIAVMILGIAIISIIAVTARSKVIPRL